MRPKDKILMWYEDLDVGGPLAYSMDHALLMTITACSEEDAFLAALKQIGSYRLVLIVVGLEPSQMALKMADAALESHPSGRPPIVALGASLAAAQAVGSTTAALELGRNNTELFKCIEIWTRRKRGPKKGWKLPNMTVAAVDEPGYSSESPSTSA